MVRTKKKVRFALGDCKVEGGDGYCSDEATNDGHKGEAEHPPASPDLHAVEPLFERAHEDLHVESSIVASNTAQVLKSKRYPKEVGFGDIYEKGDLFSVDSFEKKHVGGRLVLLAGIINSLPVSCLMDSGASTRYMAEDVAKTAGWKPDATKYGVVKVADGKAIPILGRFKTRLLLPGIGPYNDVSEEAVFTIVRMAPWQVVLGMDFWTKYRAQVSYDKIGGMRFWQNRKWRHVPPVTEKYTKPALYNHVLEASPQVGTPDIIPISWRKMHQMLSYEDSPTGRNRGFRQGFLWIIQDPQATDHSLNLIDSTNDFTNDSTNSTKTDSEDDATFAAQLRKIQREFQDILRNELPAVASGKHDYIQHRIDTGDAKPVNLPHFRLPPTHLAEQEKQISELLAKGLVRPSHSPWGAPVLFVQKHDGSWRMCVDYRALNDVTIKNKFPLPRIQEQLDQTGQALVFTKIDLLSGFWQIAMEQTSIEKTAFNTRDGKYEYLVMPMGLTNAPPTFQSAMNDLLREYLNDFVVVYIDDVLIFSKNEAEHLEHVRKVMVKLRDAGFYAKSSKCVFGASQVEFCGHTIGGGKIQMSQAKVDAVSQWPRPENVHHVRQFLGLCSYYRRFIRDFARLASPLHDLLKTEGTNKRRPVNWDARSELAFVRLKDAITAKPVLAQPDPRRPYIIETDASDYARGAVLLQKGDDGKEHPVAFESRKFIPAECNYPTHERELLAIKDAVRAWSVYFQNGHTTTVRTDHAGLQYMKTTKTPSKRLARWIAEFQEYDLDIKYKPGPQMVVADSLSRRPDYKPKDSENAGSAKEVLSDDDRTMFHSPKESLAYVINALTLALTQISDLMIPYLENGTLPTDAADIAVVKSRSHEFKLDGPKGDEDLFHQDGKDEPWVRVTPLWSRQDTLDEIHRTGHFGELTMWDILRRRCWWDGMKRDIRDFCRYCPQCQLAGARHENVARSSQVPSYEWDTTKCDAFDRWGLDLIGKCPKTKRGNIWIAVAVDYVTKWPVARALPDATAETLAEFVYDLYLNYGAPKEIITDQGANLWAPAMDLFLKKINVHHKGTTAYHPRTNGAVEALNKVLGISLTKLLYGHDKHHWDLYLDAALFSARIRTHSTTKQSPFFMLYGRHPRLPSDENGYTPADWEATKDRLPMFETARREAHRLAETRAKYNKERWEKSLKRAEVVKFKKGDYVLIRNESKKKFELNWWGPYEVHEEIKPNVYTLRTTPGRVGQNGDVLPRSITGDRLHLARIKGAITRSWNLPNPRGRPKVYGDLDPSHPISVPIDSFVPIPAKETADAPNHPPNDTTNENPSYEGPDELADPALPRSYISPRSPRLRSIPDVAEVPLTDDDPMEVDTGLRPGEVTIDELGDTIIVDRGWEEPEV